MDNGWKAFLYLLWFVEVILFALIAEKIPTDWMYIYGICAGSFMTGTLNLTRD